MAKRTKAYGLNNPLQDVFAVPVISQRSPTVNDTNYELGQRWINKLANESYVLTSSTAGAANWVITGLSESGFPITPFVVGIASQAGFQTIQAGIDAANAVGGGLVYVQGGTFTEDLTLFNNIQLMGDSEQRTTIIGTHTPPSSGTLNVSRFTLQSATDIFLSAAGGTTDITLEDCTCVVTSGFTFNLLAWAAGGSISIFNIKNSGVDDGFVNNVLGTSFSAVASAFGNGTGNVMVLSGPTEFSSSVEVGCPINLGVSAALTSNGSLYRGTLTLTGSATINSTNDRFSTSGEIAIDYNTSGDSVLSSVSIDSINDPAIDGTGVGDLVIAGVDFVNNINIAATVNVIGVNTVYGNLVFPVAGDHIELEGGAVTSFIGQATLVAGTVTVANTSISSTDRIFAMHAGLNASAAVGVLNVTIIAATSFTISALNANTVVEPTDVSTINFFIVREN